MHSCRNTFSTTPSQNPAWLIYGPGVSRFEKNDTDSVVMGYSHDGIPYCGPVLDKPKGLYMMGGFSGRGMV